MAIKNTHNTTNVPNVDHKEQSPIIIKNDSVDRAIYDAQQEISNGAKTISLDKVYTELEKKYSCMKFSNFSTKSPSILLRIFVYIFAFNSFIISITSISPLTSTSTIGIFPSSFGSFFQ